MLSLKVVVVGSDLPHSHHIAFKLVACIWYTSHPSLAGALDHHRRCLSIKGFTSLHMPLPQLRSVKRIIIANTKQKPSR